MRGHKRGLPLLPASKVVTCLFENVGFLRVKSILNYEKGVNLFFACFSAAVAAETVLKLILA
jgi:hypothetical protein